MLESLFDLPLLIAGPIIVGSLCLYAIVGLSFVRRYVLPRLRSQDSYSDFTGAMLQSVMVFYGLAVALIAVSVWQTYSDTSRVVSEEATSLAVLYRDVSSYPEPVRLTLQNELRNYVQYVIQEAWPQQHSGKVPNGGVEIMNRFQAALIAFEPATESQRLLHAETLRAYNEMIKARRLRLDAVENGFPKGMWSVIVLGALFGL